MKITGTGQGGDTAKGLRTLPAALSSSPHTHAGDCRGTTVALGKPPLTALITGCQFQGELNARKRRVVRGGCFGQYVQTA